jgi:hypothetical protein
MLKVNLVLTDYLSGKKIGCDEAKLKAANLIKELLAQIDYRAEVVPENNLEMFTSLLTSLKGEPLNNEEKELVKEIVNF